MNHRLERPGEERHALAKRSEFFDNFPWWSLLELTREVMHAPLLLAVKPLALFAYLLLNFSILISINYI
jgi:hypothetical protein